MTGSVAAGSQYGKDLAKPDEGNRNEVVQQLEQVLAQLQNTRK